MIISGELTAPEAPCSVLSLESPRSKVAHTEGQLAEGVGDEDWTGGLGGVGQGWGGRVGQQFHLGLGNVFTKNFFAHR